MDNNILITYDLSSKWTEVKSEMKKNGYLISWTSNSTTYYLPNTCLWKRNITAAQAINDLKNAVATVNRTAYPSVTLERAVAVEFSSWDAIPGQAL